MKNMPALLVLFLAVLITGCNSNNNNDINREDLDMISTDKVWFAIYMRFDSRIVFEGEVISPYGLAAIFESVHPRSSTFNPFYTEFIFVHNAEEAEGFPDNVIHAWPRDNAWTQGLIEGMHWAVSREEIGILNEPTSMRDPFTLEDFGLTYPLTITDLVDNWEKVNTLWRAFTTHERSTILSAAQHHAQPNAEQIPAN